MITATPPGAGSNLRPEPEGPSSAAPATGRSIRSRFPHLLRWVAVLLVVLVVAAVAAIYFLTSPVRIDLSVDGQTQSINTRADSVADLLADHDVTVAETDLVDPPLEAELADGDTIVVRFARPLTVVIDGSETVHTTTMLTLADALADLETPVDGAAISMPLTEALPLDGTTVEIIMPKSVSLDVGGVLLGVTSTAKTVGDVLAAEGIVLSATDTLAPSADTAVTDEMTITVTRVRVENEIRTESIAHDTVEQDDADLTLGTRRVVTEGADGAQDLTYAVTYTNGEITSEQVVSTTVTTEAVTEVVAVGTKPAEALSVDPGAASGGPASDLNWAALAQCESSGNAAAVNPAGYYGLYQFSLATWASVGGSGNPAEATPAEQLNRAQILYNRSGPGQWPHCGSRLFE